MPTRNRRRSQRGRGVVRWFVGFFVLAQVVGGLLLDYHWPEIRFPLAYQQFQRFDELPHSPDVICLGSSRIESSLHAWEITRTVRQLSGDANFVAFNACVPGGDCISAEFVWRELRERGARPKLVVLEICPEEINHLNDWLKLHVLRQFRWENIPNCTVELCRTGHLLRMLQARLMPLYAHRYHLVKSTNQSMRDWLWPTSNSPPRQAEPEAQQEDRPPPKEVALKPIQLQETQAGLHGVERGLKKYRPGGCSMRALERVLAECRDYDIPVLLLGVPLSTRHRQLYSPTIETQFRACMSELARLYGCRFADCRDQIPDWLFRDNHHAIQRGGQYFSQRFAREIIWPALKM